MGEVEHSKRVNKPIEASGALQEGMTLCVMKEKKNVNSLYKSHTLARAAHTIFFSGPLTEALAALTTLPTSMLQASCS